MRFCVISIIAGALVLAAAGKEREAVPKTEMPKREIDSWIGTAGKAESPRFTRDPATKVSWVREVAVSTMVGCEMILKEKSFAPFELVEDRSGPYYRVKGESLMLRKLLGGDTEMPPEGTKFFLVRAVYLHPLTGSFTVYFQDGDLFVEHGSLGNFMPPMKRAALVVALPEEPRSVTVRATMAR